MNTATLTRLVIARHGNTFAAGDIVRRVGVTDIPLVASGELQGRALGYYLKARGWYPAHIITSQLQRTICMGKLVQEVLQQSIPSVQYPFLNEIDYGVDENQPEEAVIARLGKEALHQWDEKALLPQGWQADIPAIISGWQELARWMLKHHQGQTILVITSNGIARFAPRLTGDLEGFAATYALKLATGAVGILTHTGEKETHWQCEGWNIRPA